MYACHERNRNKIQLAMHDRKKKKGVDIRSVLFIKRGSLLSSSNSGGFGRGKFKRPTYFQVNSLWDVEPGPVGRTHLEDSRCIVWSPKQRPQNPEESVLNFMPTPAPRLLGVTGPRNRTWQCEPYDIFFYHGLA